MTQEMLRPQLGRNVYIAPTAYVGGAVLIGDDVTIMHHVIVRGDVAPISIGARTNVQDGATVHCRTGVPLVVGREVAIGHRAVVHCRRVHDHALIGIGAIVLDDAEVGAGAIIAAGAVVPPGMVVPPGKVAIGIPAQIGRDVTPEDRDYLAAVTDRYVDLGRQHAAGVYPGVTSSPGAASRTD